MTSERWWRVRCEAGPDAGQTWVVAGRHVLGRAPQADMRCVDSSLEPFHLALDLSGDAPVVDQLAGRLPIRVSTGEPDADPPHPHLQRWFVHVGRSVFSVARAVGPATPRPGDRGRSPRPVVRSVRFVPAWAPVPVHRPIAGPEPTPPTGGAAPLVIAVATAAAMTLFLRQPMFLVLGAIGVCVAAATWASGRLRHRRRRRVHREALAEARTRLDVDLRAQRAAFATHVRRAVPTLGRALAAIDRADGPWQRRPSHGDAWCVSLGIGEVAWRPVFAEPDRADDLAFDGGPSTTSTDLLPVAVDLEPGLGLGISGPSAVGLTSSMLLQLTALTGPADWQLVVVTTSADRWRWTVDLPHAHDRTGRHLMVDDSGLAALVRDDDLTDRHTVVVTDQPALLAVRTSALRRWVAAHPSIAIVVVHDGAVPAICRSSVVTMSDGRARVAIDGQATTRPVHLAAMGPASAARWARRLRDLLDPEDDRGLDGAIPTAVSLGELLADSGIDPHDGSSIAAAWAAAGVDAAPHAPIGLAADGVVDVDLVRDGPHGLLAGTTGAGKSELLRSLVAGLAVMVPPDQLTFVLVDYKGGAAFDDLGGLPHVVGTVTDLDDQLAERALRSLRAELTHREQLLRAHGANDLASLRAAAGASVVPRVLVVVDEFAALAVEHADFLHALVDVAQRGRSLGVHLLLATQRPSGVISDDIRANTNLRLALRVHDTADAVDVVGDPRPATLARSQPGRAVMRLGPDELVTFQSARVEQPALLVAAVCRAAAVRDLAPPRRVWCDPLPDRFERLVGAAVDEIGVIDRPDRQCHEPLRWSPSTGSVAVVGATGSGVTSTLQSLAVVAVDAADEGDEAELFVIDAGDDAWWEALAAHPRCAGVVRLHERERLWRLLASVAEPSMAGVRRCLVIDGIAALRLELEALERATERELFDRIVADGSSVLIVGADRAGGVPPPVLSRCALRLVLHVHDRHDAAVMGVPPSAVPSMLPGRAALAPDGAAAQLVVPRRVRVAGRRRAVVGLGVLPTSIEMADLPPAQFDSDRWRVPLGVGFDRLEPVWLDVAPGEHVLVAGPARSGRSSALALFAGAWSRTHPGARLSVVATRRSPLAEWSAATEVHGEIGHAIDALRHADDDRGPSLLLVDDAELFDDPTGRLAALVAGRDPRVVVVAAGRPDALRQSYGHWTAAVRRSRLGLLAVGAADVDGDLLGATLPRRPLLAPRPGLMFVVDGGPPSMVQLARPALTVGDACDAVS